MPHQQRSGGEETFGGLLAAVDAVGEADAPASVAGEREAWVSVERRLDLYDAVQMADQVLRHGAFRTPERSEEGVSGDAEQLRQLVQNSRDDCWIVSAG